MVLFAKRLPVGGVPKQSAVTTMRLDVIHHLRERGQSIGLAHRAEWVAHQKLGASALPSHAITTLVAAAQVFAPTGWVFVHVVTCEGQHTPPLAQEGKALVR